MRSLTRCSTGWPEKYLLMRVAHAIFVILAPAVQFLFQLIFKHLALFLDHQNFFQSLRESAHALCFERPGHADLVQPNADVARHLLVDAQIRQRLPRIEIRFSSRDDADARMRTVPDAA